MSEGVVVDGEVVVESVELVESDGGVVSDGVGVDSGVVGGVVSLGVVGLEGVIDWSVGEVVSRFEQPAAPMSKAAANKEISTRMFVSPVRWQSLHTHCIALRPRNAIGSQEFQTREIAIVFACKCQRDVNGRRRFRQERERITATTQAAWTRSQKR